MEIKITDQHLAWLRAQVDSGMYDDMDSAMWWAIDGMMTLADDDLQWAQPFLDAAEKSIKEGGALASDFFLTEIDRMIKNLGFEPSR